MASALPIDRSAVVRSEVAPRLLIVTDQTAFGRVLEQHASIVWPEAQCRLHSPTQSGRLHSAFAALGFDVVLLDHEVERGLGREWLENLLHRPDFPPVIYLGPSDNEGLAATVVERGALDCVARERIDHRRLSAALREAVTRRRRQLALLRTASRSEELSRFGPVTILDHRFVRELASGSTSSVYLAESERAGEMVVLKVLCDDDQAPEHAHFARFLQEYELISRIRHPNVVRIFDLGIADDHAYIAMEYFPRGDLRQQIQRGMTPRAALKILVEAASALEVVHAVGVLHRDLKPGNMMTRNDGSLALIDFGLAKPTDVSGELTGIGEIFGTPYYMSPEQGHGQPVDARSDLYSLGVIFYEMLTRQKPFAAPTAMGVIYLHANAPRPQLPERFACYQSLLDRLLAVDPAQRYASATQLLQDAQVVFAQSA